MPSSPDCMVHISTPQISEHTVYPLYVQPYGGGRCREATILFFWEKSPAFWLYRGFQLVHQHVTVSSTSHSLTLFLEVHQYRAIHILKDGQHEFPSRSLCIEFFVGQRRQVLPLHRLFLTLWFIVVHSGLVSCHNSMEKSISFTSMMVQILTIRLTFFAHSVGMKPNFQGLMRLRLVDSLRKLNLIYVQ
jgi:hypothetical protein